MGLPWSSSETRAFHSSSRSTRSLAMCFDMTCSLEYPSVRANAGLAETISPALVQTKTPS